LDVYPGKLVLSGESIEKQDIELLSRYSGLLSTGLRIRRRSSDELLVFWTSSFHHLRSALLEAGFAVSGEDESWQVAAKEIVAKEGTTFLLFAAIALLPALILGAIVLMAYLCSL
jgi:hypothetical protein